MSISLFKHNSDAYVSVRNMLDAVGKAAVIHPTGTGKSFIGFKLCEDDPQGRICWLSPSEYIFKTQIENLKAAADGYEPDNIVFFTYAKLMNMSAEEIAVIKPTYIMLDEFHRAGAEQWQLGVRRLLTEYPDVPLLGLSATAIRYLDNQRNMADELFEGNIASEMTLGEAIVRGILSPPKYVLSVFSYQKDLEKYEKRIRHAKNRVVRDAAEKYLEALRRALDKADGIDAVFEKHMTEKCGKYIIFCSDFEHMREMIEKVPEWFSGIDKAPHIYSAYSDDPETDRSFADFKADESEHLKLLFCIDMLNEGIHVDDVSGVILLRPTVSPIIYKQQIGRALSAGKKKNSVIFDMVLNIENLYSIDAVEEEMQAAISYYRSLGLDDEIVNERFRVIDEVRDCIELFEKLNDTLTASWDLMYEAARRYYETYGNLDVPKRFVTDDGYTLGSWLTTQRLVHGGKVQGTLTDEQIGKLELIGMRWESVRDIAWKKCYEAAKHYYIEHGDLLVSVTENDYEGVPLGRFISNIRMYRKNGIKSAYLTPERIEALDKIGMVWDAFDYLWEQNYYAAVKYHREYGDLDVPVNYVDQDGIRLGAWLASLRTARRNKGEKARLTDDQIKRLDDIGMVWKNRYEIEWERTYSALCEYKRINGSLDIPVAYTDGEGLRLGKWLRAQRDAYKNCKLSPERKDKLDAVGMVWDIPDPWEQKFELVKHYFDEHGNVNIPANYVSEGVWISRWLYEQVARLNGRSVGKNGKGKSLTERQAALLKTVGVEAGGSFRHDVM